MNASPGVNASTPRRGALAIACGFALLAPFLGWLVVWLPPLYEWGFYWVVVIEYVAGAALASLLGIGWALGQWSGRRMLQWLLAVGAIVVVHAGALGWLTGEHAEFWTNPLTWSLWHSYFTGPLIASTIVGLSLRGWGWRWRDAGTPVGPEKRFSLRTLIALLVLSAIVLAAVRAARLIVMQLEDAHSSDANLTLRWLEPTIRGAGLWAASLPAVAALAGPRVRAISLLVSFALSLLLAGLASLSITPRMDAGAAWPEQALLLIGAALAWLFVTGTLWLARRGGWRIDRAAERLEPAISPENGDREKRA